MLLSIFIPHLTKLRWLDELGVSAAMEQDIVCKQTFVGSHYAMLDSQCNPLPVSSVGKKKGLQETKRSVYMLYTLLVLPSLVLSALVLFSPLQLLLILNSIQSGWWRWEVLGYISFPKCSPGIGVVQVSYLEVIYWLSCEMF